MSDVEQLVSIGVPTYNRANELRLCLNGLLQQTYRHLQIIISDNASTDSAVGSVIEEFAQKDSRLIHFRQSENLGAIANFQFVLDRAEGAFFMWAADDDFRDTTFVAALVDALRQNPDSLLAFCDFQETLANGADAPGYPTHLPLISVFQSRWHIVRICQYYLQPESKGKANLIYGLIRRQTLDGFNWAQFVSKYGSYGTDMLFVFWLLNRGPLAVARPLLYRCTVGNQKLYISASASSLTAKLRQRFGTLVSQVKYSFHLGRRG